MSTLLPVRMLNEHVYCPRLFALEWLHAEWADNADTVDGRRVHKRVDRESRQDIPDEGIAQRRSILLSDEELQLIARIDLVDVSHGVVMPVDYKRGSPPDTPLQAHDPERVQVCAQALLLRANGYQVETGALWFVEARRRVEIPITPDLIALTLSHRDAALALRDQTALPPPLEDSPKCPGCSLVGICLPDETRMLNSDGTTVRPLSPARDDALPLHIQMYRGFVGKSYGEIVVKGKDKAIIDRVRIRDTSSIAIYGDATVSTPLLGACADAGVSVGYMSYGGWFRGTFVPAGGVGVFARIAQHRVAGDETASLRIARSMIAAKIRNCRVLLRRNGRDIEGNILLRLKELADSARACVSAESLLGIEGAAASMYFPQFAKLVKDFPFDWTTRNRRPPKDPLNAMLSFAYGHLTREITAMLHRVGLDPYVGVLHKPRHGRPALALDLMEEFRPILSDSSVLKAVNNGEVNVDSFVVRSVGCNFTQAGRRSFIRTLERRLEEEVTHPVFGTRMTYRRILELQARLLSRVLQGEIDAYPAFRVR